jgi:hypothetical protein
MTVNIKHLAPKPIVLVEIADPFNPLVEAPPMMGEAGAIAATLPGEVYLLIDVSQWNITFDKLVDLLATGLRTGASRQSNLHPVLVGSGALVKLGVEAMKQRQYGGLQAQMFTSQEQAIAYIDGQLAQA